MNESSENSNKHQIAYQKYKSYFLDYYQKNKSRRKYVFCVICGRNNENKKYVKVCSLTCSKILYKITKQEANYDFYQKKFQSN